MNLLIIKSGQPVNVISDKSIEPIGKLKAGYSRKNPNSSIIIIKDKSQ
jgi:hypothetical protein